MLNYRRIELLTSDMFQPQFVIIKEFRKYNSGRHPTFAYWKICTKDYTSFYKNDKTGKYEWTALLGVRNSFVMACRDRIISELK